MRQLAQCQQNSRSRQAVNLGTQVMIACLDFIEQRLVLRGETFYRIGNSAVMQLQRIITANGFRLITEAIVKKSLIQQNTGMIAGERPASGVGTVHTRCQTDNKQAGIIVTKRCYRAGMVSRMLDSNLVKKTG